METNGHLQWNVRYAPGVLEAIGYNKKGEILTSKKVCTPHSPKKIELNWENPQNDDPVADGESVYVFNARITDSKGEWCQRAEHIISFKVEGNGVFLGSGNGNPISLEKDSSRERNAYCGLCQIIVRAGSHQGRLKISAASPGMERGEITLDLKEFKERESINRCEKFVVKEEIKGEIDNLL